MCSKNDDLRRRVGKVIVSNKLIDSKPRTLLECFREVLVMEVNCHNYNQTTDFIGFSDKFDLVDAGEEIPKYTVSVDCSQGKFGEVTFKRMD